MNMSNTSLKKDITDNKVAKVTIGKAKDIINFVPYLGTNILPAI